MIFSAVVSAKQSTTSTSQGAARSVSLDEQEDNQKTVLLFRPSGHWLVLGGGTRKGNKETRQRLATPFSPPVSRDLIDNHTFRSSADRTERN